MGVRRATQLTNRQRTLQHGRNCALPSSCKGSPVSEGRRNTTGRGGVVVSAWQQKQMERQARFWELIGQGKTNTAASEAVGVERSQGYRWRKAAGGRIPPAPRVVSGRF